MVKELRTYTVWLGGTELMDREFVVATNPRKAAEKYFKDLPSWIEGAKVYVFEYKHHSLFVIDVKRKEQKLFVGPLGHVEVKDYSTWIATLRKAA